MDGDDTMECTKMNCPMQAGTTTDRCGDNCPWRTTAKKGDLISRAAALNSLLMSKNYRDAHDSLEQLPAVDAVPVVRGRWIDENPDDFLDPRMKCSVCAWVGTPLIRWRYCPRCGAKMDEVERQ